MTLINYVHHVPSNAHSILHTYIHTYTHPNATFIIYSYYQHSKPLMVSPGHGFPSWFPLGFPSWFPLGFPSWFPLGFPSWFPLMVSPGHGFPLSHGFPRTLIINVPSLSWFHLDTVRHHKPIYTYIHSNTHKTPTKATSMVSSSCIIYACHRSKLLMISP